jgi:magnesium chelatase family protein
VRVNAQMDASMLRRHVRLPAEAERMLDAARERGLLSARGQHRVMRVARTIADLAGRERVLTQDLGEAIALRGDAGVGRGPAP